MIRRPLSRRTVLRGIGASLALPFLDAMAPRGLVRGALASAASVPGAAAASPLRMAFFFCPNGMNMSGWRPEGEGFDWKLGPSLEPLAPFKQQLNVITGLALNGAKAQGDGGGDHARSAAAYLTGAHPHKTAGADIHAGISVDQVAAGALGGRTRLPSLELGLERGSIAGECDSGYSCAYVSNISWRSPSNPLPHEVNPADVFDRLFGADDEHTRQRRLRERKSILDYVADDSRSLSRQLGRSDQDKLDEFTTSIREIERRVEIAREMPAPSRPDMTKPAGIPEDFGEHMRLLCDLLALSFQMDITRIGTFMVGRDGSEHTYRNLGLSDGHHSLSHHGGNPQKLEKLALINHFQAEQFAYFVKKLARMKEADGTVLDNSMILFGAGISDGNRHNHNDLPIVLAGRGGGTIDTGRHIKLNINAETPLCNLYLSMLERMGLKAPRFGDSTGTFGELTA